MNTAKFSCFCLQKKTYRSLYACFVYMWENFLQRQYFKYWPRIIEVRLLLSVLWCITQNNKKAFGAWTGGTCLCALQKDFLIKAFMSLIWSKQSEKNKWRSLRVVPPSLWSLSFQSFEAYCKGFEVGTAAHTVQEQPQCVYHATLKRVQYQKDDKRVSTCYSFVNLFSWKDVGPTVAV